MAKGKFTPKKPANLITGVEASDVDTTEIQNDEVLNEVDASTEEVENTCNDQEVVGTENAEEEKVSFVENTPNKAPVHNVRVRTNCNHRCCVGGVWYDFTKGVQCNVPDELKTILLDAGLLMPL